MRFSSLLLKVLPIALFAIACGEDYEFFWEDSREERSISDTPTPEEREKAEELEFYDQITGMPIVNLSTFRYELNLMPYHDKGYRGQNATVAILDNGFAGLESALGRTLPPDLKIEDTGAGMGALTPHGTKLAEIVYATATGKTQYDPTSLKPDIKLYVTDGPYENLAAAVDELVKLKQTDPNRTVIALYSQIWEFGGNLDGTGYIDELVSKAIRAGVIWVNAAGNLGKSSFVGDVVSDSSGVVTLPHEGKYLRMLVRQNPSNVKIVLAWRDFTSSYYYYRTQQDLDLILETADGKEIARAALIQDGKDHGSANGYSRHARELMMATLSAGTYHLRVVNRSNNFNENSKFWVTASAPGVELENANGNRFVFMPADHPDAITVGASDVNYGNAKILEDGRVVKPDVIVPSLITYRDGSLVHGTSTAAAVAAGTFALYRSAFGTMTREQLKANLNNGVLTDGVVRNQHLFELCRKEENPPAIWECDKHREWIPPSLKLPKIKN